NIRPLWSDVGPGYCDLAFGSYQIGLCLLQPYQIVPATDGNKGVPHFNKVVVRFIDLINISSDMGEYWTHIRLYPGYVRPYVRKGMDKFIASPDDRYPEKNGNDYPYFLIGFFLLFHFVKIIYR